MPGNKTTDSVTYATCTYYKKERVGSDHAASFVDRTLRAISVPLGRTTIWVTAELVSGK
jgi:hypothetical protein